MKTQGLCHCGCGQKTTISRQNHKTFGWIKDKPKKFINGHQNRMPAPYYIVNLKTGCWEWRGVLNSDGYGSIKRNGRNMKAHKYIYELAKGNVPHGLELDHLCKNKKCVNPDHLEIVNHTENMRRAKSVKLDKIKVDEIRKLLTNGLPNYKIAAIFGLTKNHVSLIKRDRIWRAT